MVEAGVDGEIDRGLGVDGVKSATISRGGCESIGGGVPVVRFAEQHAAFLHLVPPSPSSAGPFHIDPAGKH